MCAVDDHWEWCRKEAKSNFLNPSSSTKNFARMYRNGYLEFFFFEGKSSFLFTSGCSLFTQLTGEWGNFHSTGLIEENLKGQSRKFEESAVCCYILYTISGKTNDPGNIFSTSRSSSTMFFMLRYVLPLSIGLNLWMFYCEIFSLT